jgi:hypothetical protein
MSKQNGKQSDTRQELVTVVIPNEGLDKFPHANVELMSLSATVKQEANLTYLQADVPTINQIARILRAYDISFRYLTEK